MHRVYTVVSHDYKVQLTVSDDVAKAMEQWPSLFISCLCTYVGLQVSLLSVCVANVFSRQTSQDNMNFMQQYWANTYTCILNMIYAHHQGGYEYS